MAYILRMGIIMIIGGLLTACGSADTSGARSPTPGESAAASPTTRRMILPSRVQIPAADPSVALLRYFIHGGFCVDPDARTGYECAAAFTLNRDGRLRVDSASGPQELATITAAELQTLTDQIAAMDLEVMRATPFTEMCPTAYDAQEVIVTFFMPTGPEVLASCTVVMDFTQPPLNTIRDLIERYSR